MEKNVYHNFHVSLTAPMFAFFIFYKDYYGNPLTTLGKILPPFRLLIRKNISNCARKLSYIVESSHRSYRSRILHNNHCLLLHTALFSEQQCQEERERERGILRYDHFFPRHNLYTHTHTHTHRHTHTHTHTPNHIH